MKNGIVVTTFVSLCIFSNIENPLMKKPEREDLSILEANTKTFLQEVTKHQIYSDNHNKNKNHCNGTIFFYIHTYCFYNQSYTYKTYQMTLYMYGQRVWTLNRIFSFFLDFVGDNQIGILLMQLVSLQTG